MSERVKLTTDGIIVRILELAGLFVALPVLYAMGLLPVHIVLILAPVALWSVIVLRFGHSRPNPNRWKLKGMRKELIRIGVTFILVAIVLTAALLLLRPSAMFGFVLRNPTMWGLVMVLYPLLSAFPQELVYREFFFERYRPFIPNERVMILVSALAFGFMHVALQNWVAVIFSSLGGLLFSVTYVRTRSLLLVSIEHALYGCWIFTIGLGYFFYHGAVR